MFWSPARSRDRFHEFNISIQDTLLGGATERVKLDEGRHLDAIDDSDFTDFINHHALPREDRVYLLGNLTDWTPKKRLKKPSRSGLVNPNVTNSFPVETEQHELDPKGTGADELVSDEMSLDDENGCDSETSARKPWTSSQKKVVQNIHNCGHPSKTEFSSQPCPTRGFRQRATRVRVSSMCSQRTSSKS